MYRWSETDEATKQFRLGIEGVGLWLGSSAETWLPDQWANFVGGAVNLVTRSALDREGPFATLQSGMGQHVKGDEDSYRASATYGQAWGDRVRVGVQLSADVLRFLAYACGGGAVVFSVICYGYFRRKADASSAASA